MKINKDQEEAFISLKNKRHLSRTQKVKLFDKDSCVQQEDLITYEPSSDRSRRTIFTYHFINNFLVPGSNYYSAKTLAVRIKKLSKDSSLCDKELLFSEIKKIYEKYSCNPFRSVLLYHGCSFQRVFCFEKSLHIIQSREEVKQNERGNPSGVLSGNRNLQLRQYLKVLLP